MEETMWGALRKAVEGDVISLFQLILFLILFRDRLGGHSLARDIGKLLACVQNIEKKIDSSNRETVEILARVKSIEKIDKRDQREAAS